MKKILAILLVLLFPISSYAFTDTAKSTIVMDMDSGRVLYENNADEPRLVASITKIMTAVVAIENGNLNDMVEVGEEVLSMYGSNIYIEIGEKMALRDLLYGLLLRSGNDAAIAIATYISGNEEEFVKLMNKKAKEIGMKNTTYKNCHGLDENTKNYSTARDMALLSSYANKIKEYRDISGTKKWTAKSNKKTYTWNNRNKLLYSYKNTTGGKTGYTPSAGRTLVTTASKNHLNLTIVTLKDSNEYMTHESLYEYIFNKYTNYIIIEKGKISINKEIYNTDCYIDKSFIYPLKESEKDRIKVIVKLPKKSILSKEKTVGYVNVYLNDKEIYKDSVYRVSNEENSSFLEKVRKLFKKLLNN